MLLWFTSLDIVVLFVVVLLFDCCNLVLIDYYFLGIAVVLGYWLF